MKQSKKYTIRDFLEVKSAFCPSFNFDSSKIAFLSNLTGTYQLYITSSKNGKPKQITSYDDLIAFAVFSPTQDKIIFGKATKGDEQTQFFLYTLATKKIKAITDNPLVKYNFGQFSRDGKYISYSHNERNGKDFDVCIMDLQNEKIECVYNQGGNCFAVGFSPLNSYLVIKKVHSNLNSDLFLLVLGNKKIELITPHSGDMYFGNTTWLPDETAFYTTTNQDRDFIGLSKFDVQSKKFNYVYTPEWDVENASISYDGKFLATIVNENGYKKLSLLESNSLKETGLNNLPKIGVVSSVRFSKDSKYLALCVGDSLHTVDIWVYEITNNKCWQITHSPQDVPPKELVEPSLVKFASFDGLEIPAFLYLPRNTAREKKIPVIINIHGGPESQSLPSLALLTQYFVYHGYAVIAPNVRGSSGYGKKYLALDDVEKRLDSVKDLASLHGYIKTIDQLDGQKVVLMGGSYGGFMVLAGLAFYPDLWVAGISIVGIANFVTFLENTAPYRRAIREAEYGSLEKHKELLYLISPINHAQNIKAPLFVIHGAKDPRVPLDEAKQIVKKLQLLGRDVEFVVYPDEGHGLSKLKNRLDAYPKVIAFLKKILKQ